ncbi:4-coumarate:coa ligase-like protein [Leishmania mexicana MHOM/GT/2001/U1103]|uniref:4-coumarate:coa ligase-like protein n=1 Tax=Leishmania mexicana (strain MHOM/GT/2001/U1103) TaxID=929439 RepID=E9AS51_LEIMU|nr:4-coumarate:coa ligase-like protein [Leishmania mexicana MHOM/GT/2001/U1103]CBZ25772.1 4-coumarate:coa ligase-like protein [Leishmania mexicana MHOM/GT/2001/U1103]
MLRNTTRWASVLGAQRCGRGVACRSSTLLAGGGVALKAPRALTVPLFSHALTPFLRPVATAMALTHQARFASTTSTPSATATATSAAADAGARIYKSRLPSVMDRVNMERTLYEYLMKRIKAKDPKKIAAVQAENGKELTYSKVIQATDWCARALYHHAKVRKGDVVCMCMLNTIIYGPVVYGALRLGALIAPVNAIAEPSLLAYFMTESNATVILGMRYFRKQLEEAVAIVEKDTGRKVAIHYPEDFFKRWYIWPVPRSYDGLKGATLDDTVAIPFSSGTGGLSKGVKLSNRALIANTEQLGAAFEFSPDDAGITILPFFHIYGFTACLNAGYAHGVMQIVMYKYTVEDYLKASEKYKATVNLVAPPILISLLKNSDKVKQHDLSSLKRFCCGAAPLGPETVEAIEKMLPNVSVTQAYGMTEMAPAVTVPNGLKHKVPGACGVLVADTELRIVKVDDSQQSGTDKSAGIDAEAGAEGEVWVRGPQMMKGYLRDEDTAVCMQDGWYRTGDIGKFDAEAGELVITDRLKELIKYKGFQVSPASLEALLLTHPWVKDCVVIGVPDPRDVSFENPRALVSLQPSVSPKDAVRASDELYRFVMSRMPPHKRLHGGVRIVSEVPRNLSGKLLRRQARKDEAELIKAQMEKASAAKETSAKEAANASA